MSQKPLRAVSISACFHLFFVNVSCDELMSFSKFFTKQMFSSRFVFFVKIKIYKYSWSYLNNLSYQRYQWLCGKNHDFSGFQNSIRTVAKPTNSNSVVCFPGTVRKKNFNYLIFFSPLFYFHAISIGVRTV